MVYSLNVSRSHAPAREYTYHTGFYAVEWESDEKQRLQSVNQVYKDARFSDFNVP